MSRIFGRRVRVLLACLGLSVGWICQEAFSQYQYCDSTSIGTCSGNAYDDGSCGTNGPICSAATHTVNICVDGLGLCPGASCAGTCVGTGTSCGIGAKNNQCSP